MLDFERHDDDELGFRKNDIVTVSCADAAFFFTVISFHGWENKTCYVDMLLTRQAVFQAIYGDKPRECLPCRTRVRGKLGRGGEGIYVISHFCAQ